MQSHLPSPAILRPSQASKYLGVCCGTLYRWQKLGIIPKAIRLGSQAVGFRKEDLDKWLQSRQPNSSQKGATAK